MSFIEIRGLTKIYRRSDAEVKPLVDVDLDIESGEFFVLLGPSGSGKSTLLNLLAGIDRPSDGRIVVGGKDLTTMSRRALSDWRAESVGYIFQQCHLVPVLTAYENVELPLHLFGLSSAEKHRRVALALEAVGLSDRLDHLPRQLSGGQEQRVAIARAIVADPPLLVADEPTGNLDHESATATMRLLARLNKERNKTIVMVTHDRAAARHGSRCMFLDKGRMADHELEEARP